MKFKTGDIVVKRDGSSFPNGEKVMTIESQRSTYFGKQSVWGSPCGSEQRIDGYYEPKYIESDDLERFIPKIISPFKFILQ